MKLHQVYWIMHFLRIHWWNKKRILIIKIQEIIKSFICFWNFWRSLSGIDVKNLLKWLARLLLLVTVLLSIVRLMFWFFLFLILIIDLIPFHSFLHFFCYLWNIPCSSFPYRIWIILLHGSCELWIFFFLEFFFFVRISGFAKLYILFITVIDFIHGFVPSFNLVLEAIVLG